MDRPSMSSSSCQHNSISSYAPQSALDGRVVNLPQGRILGGGSTVNFMNYVRGPRDDYDNMARVTNDQSWSFESMLYYLKKVSIRFERLGQYV